MKSKAKPRKIMKNDETPLNFCKNNTQTVSIPPAMTGVSHYEDPWPVPEVLVPTSETRGRNPVLPLDTLLAWQNRPVCSQLCRCSRPCVVTRAGHALHFCRICVDQRPVGEPRSGV